MHSWLSAATAAEPAGFLLDHIADAVIAIDADWRIRYWNQAATTIYGWRADEMLARPISPVLDVVRYLDASEPEQVLAQTMREGVWRGEVVQQHRDGRLLIIEAATHLLRDASGAVIGMVAVNRDVTARHTLELERRAALVEAQLAQQRLALLADVSLALSHTPDAAAALARMAELLVGSIADWCIVDRCDEAGTLRRVALAASDPEQQALVIALRQASVEQPVGDERATKVVAQLSDNASPYLPLLRTLAASALLVVPLRNGERLLGRLILARAAADRPFSADDCTLAEELAHRTALAVVAAELHEAAQESTLRAAESRALIESLLDAAPVGFAFIDPELRFQVINERLATCNGRTIAEHLGRTIREIIPALADALEPIVRRVLATGQPMTDVPLAGDTLGPAWQGKHWLETFYPVVTPSGQQLGVGVVSVEVTEIRRLGLDLARSQLQLAEIIGSAMDAIITVDERQQIVLFNRAAEELFGVAAADVLGASLARFMPDDLRVAHRGYVEAFGSTGSPAGHRANPQAPMIALRADGSSFPIETSISQIVVDGEKLYTVILRDVSARLTAEQQLRSSEANLRAVFDNTAQSFVLLDHDRRLVLWNRLANERSITVTGKALVAGMSIEEYTVQELIPALRVSLAKAARGEPVHVERSLGTPEEPLWLAFDYIPVRDGADQVIGTCMTTLDITAQRTALEAVTRSEERFRALVAEASDVIVLLDNTLTVCYASPAWERVLGCRIEEWIGHNPFCLIHRDDQPLAQQVLRRLLGGVPEPVQATVRLRHAGGGWVWAEMIGTDLRAHVAVQGVVLTFRDITERKRLTAQLTQAQKMESVGRLAGGVAHDFNNLLTAMGGYVELALDSLPQDTPAHVDLLEVQKTVRRAGELIRQLLAFARKQDIAPQPCALNALILDMERLLRRVIGDHIVLVTELAPDLGFVMVDPGQIEQVIVNLAVNARDAMPNGGTLRIQTANVTVTTPPTYQAPALPASDYIRLTISDTGVGMDEQVREHVFEPFFTTKGAERGTGLGLATCYGIVVQHGGAIDVASQPGAGTTFVIYLPRTLAVPQPSAEPQMLPTIAGAETVLVVEDDEAVRTLAGRILREHGYTVLEARNGFEAMQVFVERDGIQLVLSDIEMPRMNGRELVGRLRAQRPQLPMVCMSGYTDDAHVTKGLHDQHIRLIHKPFDAPTLLRVVREALDQAVPASSSGLAIAQ
jgi:two-component system, cell cycle sensor histidine kinase and response regulator CckA